MQYSPSFSLWRSRNTVQEMLTDRKIQVPEDSLTYQDFVDRYGEDPTEIRKELAQVFGKIAVFWLESLGISDVQHVKMRMADLEVNHSIVIYNNKITSYAATALRSLKAQKIIIETFSEQEMQINITKHELQPRHIICSLATKKEMFAAYSVNPSMIPQIKASTDPVCRWYGAEKGQLIKIVRPSESIKSVVLPDGKVKEFFDIYYRSVVA